MQTTFMTDKILVTNLYKDFAVKSSEEIPIIEFDNTNAHKTLGSEKTVFLLTSELRFKIIYKSMYDVKFETTDKKRKS